MVTHNDCKAAVLHCLVYTSELLVKLEEEMAVVGLCARLQVRGNILFVPLGHEGVSFPINHFCCDEKCSWKFLSQPLASELNSLDI